MICKKVGIITFHRADNLGAVLQAYALQRTLADAFGADASIIDYRCSQIEGDRKSGRGVKALALWGYYAIKHRGFESFRKKYLKLSPACTSETAYLCADEYDVFITGSDQVWNYECSGWDDAYFLDFVPAGKPRYSYAASLGNYRFSEQERLRVRGMLESFSGISVREPSGKKELESMGLDPITLCPDPVLLLTQEDWKPVMSKRLCHKRYILVYLIQPDVNVLRNAEAYASKHGCKLINNKKSIEFMLRNSPADFLSWIYHAECVFTNSFHGTALALIFRKPLAADIELRGGGINHRVQEMLQAANALDCVLRDGQEPTAPVAGNSLETLREDGMSYLHEMMEGVTNGAEGLCRQPLK